MPDQISKSLERFYFQFVLTDLAYVASGATLLSVTIYVVQEGCLYWEDVNLAFGIGFLITSYFLGHLIQYLGLMLHVVDDQPIEVGGRSSQVELSVPLLEKVGEVGMREYDRVAMQKHIGAAIGPACLLSFLILFFFRLKNLITSDVVILTYLLIATILCFRLNTQMLEFQDRLLIRLFYLHGPGLQDQARRRDVQRCQWISISVILALYLIHWAVLLARP